MFVFLNLSSSLNLMSMSCRCHFAFLCSYLPVCSCSGASFNGSVSVVFVALHLFWVVCFYLLVTFYVFYFCATTLHLFILIWLTFYQLLFISKRGLRALWPLGSLGPVPGKPECIILDEAIEKKWPGLICFWYTKSQCRNYLGHDYQRSEKIKHLPSAEPCIHHAHNTWATAARCHAGTG